MEMLLRTNAVHLLPRVSQKPLQFDGKLRNKNNVK